MAALHQAAHFVTLIMGYRWEDEDVPRGSTPHVLSIKGKATSDYFLRDPAMFLPVLAPQTLVHCQQVRYAIVLLSGAAAQYAYGLTYQNRHANIVSAFEDDYDPSPDLAKVMKLTAAMVPADGANPTEQAQALALRLWQFTVEFLQAGVVQQAIEHVAGQLEEQKEIYRPALFELQEAVFALPGFSELRMPIPALPLV